MRKPIGVTCAVALLGLMAAPAMAQSNLLLNPSFEEAAGNSQIWMGDYSTYNGPAAHNPNPMIYDGLQGLANLPGVADGEVIHTTWQTVAVSPTATLSFTGYAVVGPGANATNQVVIQLLNGGVTGAVIAGDTIDKADPPTWNQVSLSGTADTGLVTVKIQSTCETPCYEPLHECAAAARVDHFTLTSSEACTTQHTLTQNQNPTGNHDEDKTITLLGTDLDQVSDVKLVQAESQTVIDGTISLSFPTVIQVDLPIASEAPALGYYTIITEQPDCVAQTLVDAFEIVCSNPCELTGLQPPLLKAPQGEVEFTISGTNLVKDGASELSSVSLRLGSHVLTDDTPTVSGEQLLATFDLTGLPAGHYDLSGTRTDACDDPPVLSEAFVLQSELDLPNLLANPGFEDSLTGWDPIEGRAALEVVGSGWFGGTGPHTGTYCAGSVVNGGGPVSRGAMQTITVDNPRMCGPQTYNLTLSFWAWVWAGDPNASGYDSYVEGQLWVDGVQVASARRSSLDHPDPPIGEGSDYVQYVATWSGEVNTWIEARILLTADGRLGSTIPVANWGVVVADDIELTAGGCKVCPDPFADFDEDGDVDQDDFAFMQACMSGNGGGILPGCDCADADGERDINNDQLDVDQADWQLFEACASGPDVPADDTCDDPPPP